MGERYFILRGLRVDLLPDGTWFCENEMILRAINELDRQWNEDRSAADGDPFRYAFDRAVDLLNPEEVVDNTVYSASTLGQN